MATFPCAVTKSRIAWPLTARLCGSAFSSYACRSDRYRCVYRACYCHRNFANRCRRSCPRPHQFPDQFQWYPLCPPTGLGRFFPRVSRLKDLAFSLCFLSFGFLLFATPTTHPCGGKNFGQPAVAGCRMWIVDSSQGSSVETGKAVLKAADDDRRALLGTRTGTAVDSKLALIRVNGFMASVKIISR